MEESDLDAAFMMLAGPSAKAIEAHHERWAKLFPKDEAQLWDTLMARSACGE